MDRFFTTATRTDIFQIAISPALPDGKLDPIEARVISTVKFIE